MSTAAPTLRRIWLPLVSAALALALGVGLLAYAVVEGELRSSLTTLLRPDTVSIPQAKWRIRIDPVRVGRLSKHQRAVMATQRSRVAAAIREIYNGVFLENGTLARGAFTRGAAAKFVRSGAGVPDDATATRTLRRSARIALYAAGASQAAARVRVIARTTVEGRVIRLDHKATLWLVRDGRRWAVVGFKIDQRRVA